MPHLPKIVINTKTIIISVILTAATLALFKFLGSDVLNSQVTLYPIVCQEEVFLNQCDNPSYPLAKITYRIVPQYKEVFYWTEERKTQKFSDCEIQDRKNWSCSLPDAAIEFGLKEGIFWQSTPAYNQNIYYASKYQWLKLHCANTFNFLCLPVAMFYN